MSINANRLQWIIFIIIIRAQQSVVGVAPPRLYRNGGEVGAWCEEGDMTGIVWCIFNVTARNYIYTVCNQAVSLCQCVPRMNWGRIKNMKCKRINGFAWEANLICAMWNMWGRNMGGSETTCKHVIICLVYVCMCLIMLSDAYRCAYIAICCQ